MLVCSSNKRYIGLMEEDLDLDDLVAYRPRGSGHFLNKSQRRQIAYGYMVLHLSAREIHNNYFEGVTRHPLCTIGRIRDILGSEVLDPQRYVGGPYRRRGLHRGYLIRGSLEAVSLMDLFSDGHYTCLWALWRDFKELYYENPDDALHYSTVVRFFHLNRYSRMVMERRHILRDEQRRLDFMIDVAQREVGDLIFMDETLTTAKEYLEKYGWGIKGEKCIKTQFVVCGKHFSAFALYCDRGFLAWKILEGDNTAEDFQLFMEECREVIPEGSHLILDNSALHHTLASLIKINDVCRGDYEFLSPYSPDLNPIENGFSQLKRYLRDRENLVVADPLAEIDAAFRLYSVGGERGHLAWGNFEYYRNRYDNVHAI